jgi:predicted RNase H-like HicB family nuclease
MMPNITNPGAREREIRQTIPGCMAYGKTKREALTNAESAINLWIETAKEDGEPIPEPRGRLIFA